MTAGKAPARIAVIGAGVAGLACAQALRERGAEVSVFEKDEVPGGRAATLIEDCGPYDPGAQYFTAHSARFVAAVEQWQAAGLVERWRGRIVAFTNGAVEDKTESAERFVAVPGMRRLGVALAQGLDVRYRQPIGRLQRRDGAWHLAAEGATELLGPFDAVCTALPSPAAAALLDGHTPLAEWARTVGWDAGWSVMLALGHRTGVDFAGAFVNDDPILGWAALDSAKPRRGQVEGVAERWVLHAKPAWARRYIEMDEAAAARWLARAFSARVRRNLVPIKARALRWRCALPLNPLPQRYLWDPERQLGMAGDWCDGPRIEGAFLSGRALADAIFG